jgi:threonine dehydratase
MSSLDFNDILQARQHLRGLVRETPFDRSLVLGDRTNMEVYLKAECLQRTGSFKLRGAYHKIASLTAEEKTTGIVTSSAGNHAQGVGFAATLFNIPARIFVPQLIPQNKLEAIQRYRVEVVIEGKLYDEAHAAALADAKKSGRVFIPAFEDSLIMAGHGTLGLEMLEEISDLDALIVPVGGGGMIAGVATAAKTINADIRIIGCQSIANWGAA